MQKLIFSTFLIQDICQLFNRVPSPSPSLQDLIEMLMPYQDNGNKNFMVNVID
jgi:hypothetical protein